MQGLAGLAATQKKSMIITDIKNSKVFDKAIDIESLLPILAFPILNCEFIKRNISSLY